LIGYYSDSISRTHSYVLIGIDAKCNFVSEDSIEKRLNYGST
jgi:hypothetical protein